MKTEIEWVEIPAGEFIFGLSNEQILSIKDKIRKESGHKEIPSNIESLIQKLVYTSKGEPKLTKLEVDLLKSNEYEYLNIITAEHLLNTNQYKPNLFLDKFYISKFPITYLQIRSVLDNFYSLDFYSRWMFFSKYRNPSYEKIPAMVSWKMADLFCKKIGARLPTAEEWEKAARGTDGRLYPWGDEWDNTRGNFDGTKASQRFASNKNINTLASYVDEYPTGISPYGVWDMAGNVFEWTSSMDTKSNNSQIMLKKSCSIKYSQTKWVGNILSFYSYGEKSNINEFSYTGFRPVKMNI